LHSDLKKSFLEEFWAIHKKVVIAIESDDLAEIEALAEASTACVKQLLISGELGKPGYEEMVRLKEELDEFRIRLEQEKSKVYAEISDNKQRGKCAKGYERIIGDAMLYDTLPPRR
jgi:hypothetical protein